MFKMMLSVTSLNALAGAVFPIPGPSDKMRACSSSNRFTLPYSKHYAFPPLTVPGGFSTLGIASPSRLPLIFRKSRWAACFSPLWRYVRIDGFAFYHYPLPISIWLGVCSTFWMVLHHLLQRVIECKLCCLNHFNALKITMSCLITLCQ